VRTSGLPEIESAVDRVLHAAELEIVELDLPAWDLGSFAFTGTYFAELWDADHELVDHHREGVGDDIANTVAMCDILDQWGNERRAADARSGSCNIWEEHPLSGARCRPPAGRRALATTAQCVAPVCVGPRQRAPTLVADFTSSLFPQPFPRLR
jgi:hypothetical protein